MHKLLWQNIAFSSILPLSYIFLLLIEKVKAFSSLCSVPYSGTSLFISLNKCFHPLIVNPPKIYPFFVLIKEIFGPI